MKYNYQCTIPKQKYNPKNYEYWSSLVSKMPSESLGVWSWGECGGDGGGGRGGDSGGCTPDNELPLDVCSK